MRFSARSVSSAYLLTAASALAACAPSAPSTDASVESSTRADRAASTRTAETSSTGSTAGPTYDAPCASLENGTARSADTPSRSHAFALRADIRACVHLRAQSEGGRRSAVFNHYRPNVRFLGTDGEVVATALCALRFDAEGAVEPGSTIASHLKCEAPVALEDGSAFVLVEGGRDVGGGIVVLPPA